MPAVKLAAEAGDRLRPAPRGVTVLIYHRVGGGSGLQIDLSPDRFDEQVRELAPRAVDLVRALELLPAAPPPGPDPVVLTFDDGTADVVDVALPVLMRHGVPATLYVATDFVERGEPFPAGGRPASWAGLRDAVATGLVALGSHTHRHVLLDRLPPQEIDEELRRSVELLEDRVQVEVADFAYPKAVAPSSAADRAVRARFRSAALAGTRPNPYGATDPHRLARSPIQVADGMRWFRRKASGGMRFEDALRSLANRRRYDRATT